MPSRQQKYQRDAPIQCVNLLGCRKSVLISRAIQLMVPLSRPPIAQGPVCVCVHVCTGTIFQSAPLIEQARRVVRWPFFAVTALPVVFTSQSRIGCQLHETEQTAGPNASWYLQTIRRTAGCLFLIDLSTFVFIVYCLILFVRHFLLSLFSLLNRLSTVLASFENQLENCDKSQWKYKFLLSLIQILLRGHHAYFHADIIYIILY